MNKFTPPTKTKPGFAFDFPTVVNPVLAYESDVTPNLTGTIPMKMTSTSKGEATTLVVTNPIKHTTTNPLKMTISSSNGLMSGTFLDENKVLRTFAGAFLQKQMAGAGSFSEKTPVTYTLAKPNKGITTGTINAPAFGNVEIGLP